MIEIRTQQLYVMNELVIGRDHDVAQRLTIGSRTPSERLHDWWFYFADPSMARLQSSPPPI
jgi:hypothetical protein